MAHAAIQHLDPAVQACVEDCLNCYEICAQAVEHCLRKGGEHAAPDHVRLLQDCAGICRTSADFMLRGSEFHGRACGVCADICERCASDCESLEDDEFMKQCAELCRRCAESCRKMAA